MRSGQSSRHFLIARKIFEAVFIGFRGIGPAPENAVGLAQPKPTVAIVGSGFEANTQALDHIVDEGCPFGRIHGLSRFDIRLCRPPDRCWRGGLSHGH